ncbi:MAG: UDP-N-acetylmuramoyl-tripeptide--D-alanyl-D-alanine ligase [Cyanobacteria bacterium P01_H01_bin.15]
MAFKVQLSQLSDITGAISNQESVQMATGLSTDTRTLTPGQIFVALTGERFDGHDYLAIAAKQGAIAAIVSRIPENVPSGLILYSVENTLRAYQQLGQWWRKQFAGPVIGVTGSVGKTTTKELIAAVLGIQGAVLKTEANFNNEIGVPKTLLGLSNTDRYAVIEMAMRGPGEIAELTEIACPDIGVITNVGTAHIGRLGSEENIARAKCELLASMPKSSVAILNGEDARLLKTAAQVWSGQTITYGIDSGDFRGRLEGQGIWVEQQYFPLPLPGRHNALNFLAALAITKVLGIAWEPLQTGLTVTLPKGRAQRYELANDVVILDETYNAGVESMIAALKLLKETPGQRHIAVLGTMKELGEFGYELHRRVGQTANQLSLDGLVVLQDEEATAGLLDGAPDLAVYRTQSHAEVLDCLKTLVKPGDRVLFKASNSVGLGQVANQLRAQWGETDSKS